MNHIAENDTVKLKSGGPEMKVIKIDTNDYAFCSWTNKRLDDMKGHFPILDLLHLLGHIVKRYSVR